MKHGSLFNGIGGFQLAAEYMGWQNVFSCEIDKFCNQVTKYHYPKCTQYEDIKKTDFTQHKGKIDILTGGFPCQPFSVAGKRLGTADDRNLWPEMYRAIKEIQPHYVIAENVRGIISWSKGLVFKQVCSDLENEGYEVLSFVLPAAGVNAPHKRERVWFIAYRPNTRIESLQFGGKNGIYGFEDATNTQCKRGLQREQIQSSKFSNKDGSKKRVTSDSNTKRRKIHEQSQTKGTQNSNELFVCECTVQNWNDFPTQSPICSRNDGVSFKLDGITFSNWRRQSIKAYGNAIVPQVALQIFKTIKQFENEKK